MSEWIEHTTDTCPVDPNTVVEYRLEEDDPHSVETDPGPAWRLDWTTKGKDWSITHYRVATRPPPPQPDPVNHPSHYTDGGIETIDYLEAKLGPDGFRAFCLGNALKYVSRAGKKGDLKQDLSKAIWYLRRIGGD